MRSDVEKYVKKYQKLIVHESRFYSFDYCYNYYYKANFISSNADLEKACSNLGFYLASWGMLRGSSFLLQKSYRYFLPLVKYLSNLDLSVWDYKPSDFLDKKKREVVIEIYSNIKELIIQESNNEIILITKIMLGTLGIVPAFDNFFVKTFKEIDPYKSRFSAFNENSLIVIGEFYLRNQKIVDNLSNSIFTRKFEDDTVYLRYPEAKIIDMYGFSKGYNGSKR